MNDVYEEDLDLPQPTRRIFCNRTLNLRSIRAVGFDMDYTLIHYDADEWEREAYAHLKSRLEARGWPVDGLTFDPKLVALGLVLDLEHGNIVKANSYCLGLRQQSRGDVGEPATDDICLVGRGCSRWRRRRGVLLVW